MRGGATLIVPLPSQRTRMAVAAGDTEASGPESCARPVRLNPPPSTGAGGRRRSSPWPDQPDSELPRPVRVGHGMPRHGGGPDPTGGSIAFIIYARGRISGSLRDSGPHRVSDLWRRAGPCPGSRVTASGYPRPSGPRHRHPRRPGPRPRRGLRPYPGAGDVRVGMSCELPSAAAAAASAAAGPPPPASAAEA